MCKTNWVLDCKGISYSTHWGRVTYICVIELGDPKHQLNECWHIVNDTIWNKLPWNLTQNLNVFVEEMHLKTLSGKWQPFCLGFNVFISFSLAIAMFFFICVFNTIAIYITFDINIFCIKKHNKTGHISVYVFNYHHYTNNWSGWSGLWFVSYTVKSLI